MAAASKVERNVILRQLETGLNATPTSSVGRLFDAVASLADVRQRVTYEGQAAVEFEAKAEAKAKAEGYEFEVWEDGEGELVFGAGPVVRAVAADVLAGVPAGAIASRFHVALADLSLRLGLRLREQHGLNTVALSGGVYQNTTLLRLTVDRLEGAGFRVLWHRLVPPNDGGLALGQAAIAQHMDRGFHE